MALLAVQEAILAKIFPFTRFVPHLDAVKK
jgi:hypothetical protein